MQELIGHSVVYRDARYTLGQKDEKPYLIADGRTFLLSCHPYEPCLYITDADGSLTAVHNAFDPYVVLEAFSGGGTITSITGMEYDAADFCRMVEYAADRGNIQISDAEKVFGERPKKKADPQQPKEPEPVRRDPGADRTPDDPVYALLARYPDSEVDWCIVHDDMPYGGSASHWRALAFACRKLFTENGEAIWQYDVGKACAQPVAADAFFASGKNETKRTYRNAFLYPPHQNAYTVADFVAINQSLFPNGTAELEIFEWSTDWSEYFDDGHEWWGTLCATVYDKSLDRFVVIMASATD